MKIISEHLEEAIQREGLSKRDAAKALNLNPIYITMALIEKYWDSMSKGAWAGLANWHDSRCKITEYQIPEGEEIWEKVQKKEQKPTGIPREKKIPKSVPTISESSPAPEQNKDIKSIALKETKNLLNRIQDFSDTAKLKVCLDIEINLVVNGQKIKIA